ncbi:rRNA maturation RNase YbeY [soil metagenome]
MIVNLQRKFKLDSKAFRAFIDEVLATVDEASGGDVSVAFVSERRMRELNTIFRGKDGTTDVLSFPHEADEFEVQSTSFSSSDEGQRDESITPNFLGDIVISAEQAAKQAEENDLSLELEIKQLILHGVLHLCGYDHEADDGEMNARELELRDKLSI